MNCRRLYRNSIIAGLVALTLTQPLTVYADNTEDLLNVYGLTLGGPVKSEIENEINDAERDMQQMQTQQAINDEYNAMLENYIVKREEQMNRIISNVSVYQNMNKKIVNDIETGLLNSDIDSLLQLDGDYKSNTSSMDSLLSIMNDYSINYSSKYITGDLSEVEQRLENAKTLYIESLDAYNLGDVTNIKWILPNERHINSSYGYRADPIVAGTVRFHAGTDYRAVTGMEIGALFNGVVSSCGWSDTIGYYITVQCGDNVKYLVCHCSKLNVEEGQQVKQYDTIAYVGGTGSRCTGPHLHLALYLNGVTYDVNELFE